MNKFNTHPLLQILPIKNNINCHKLPVIFFLLFIIAIKEVKHKYLEGEIDGKI